MDVYKIATIILILSCLNECIYSQEGGLTKRILIEDNYYTLVNKLNNLTREVETLNQKVRDLQPAMHTTSLSTSISGSQHQNIIFDDVELYLGNAYNAHHGNFLAPVKGTYLFSIYVCSHSGHTIVIDLMRNGVTVGRLLAGDISYSNCNSNTFILQLNHGDDIYITEGTFGDLLEVSATFGRPYFLGVLINAN